MTKFGKKVKFLQRTLTKTKNSWKIITLFEPKLEDAALELICEK